MENRVAMVSIVVEDAAQTPELNRILSLYGSYIIGRMGLPYPKRDISLISIAMDAPANEISAMTGKIGMLSGVSSKAVYSKVRDTVEEA